MFVPPRQIENLGDLGFGHLVGENPAQSDAVLVDVQHYGGRLVTRLLEKALQDIDHEFHRREIVVQQKYLVQRRLLGARQRLGSGAAIGGVVGIVVVVPLVIAVRRLPSWTRSPSLGLTSSIIYGLIAPMEGVHRFTPHNRLSAWVGNGWDSRA